jgi:hypothetical protein
VRKIFFLAILMGYASPALAQSICLEPVMPAQVDGSVASADQLRAAMAEARAFIAESSVYQGCLLQEVDAAKTQAAATGQPFEPMVEISARNKIAASEKAQDKVGDAINGSVSTYKLVHAD